MAVAERVLAVALFSAVASVGLGGCGGPGAGWSSASGAPDMMSFATDDGGTGGGSSGGPVDFGGTGVFTSDTDGGPPQTAAPCSNGSLDCYVPKNCTTSLSGTVYDPAGRTPLYNAVVFVPNDPKGTLPPITPGTNSCNSCDTPIGNYVAVAQSDIHGKFTMTGVPATNNVPFVVQIGKWRRRVFLKTVQACTDNAVPSSASRLPASHLEGDMPQMAIATGEADNLGCFLHDIGIADSEFSAPGTSGRLHVYQGASLAGGFTGGLFGGGFGAGAPGLSSGTAGDCSNSSCPLWSSKASLEKYDIVLLACEGQENLQTKPASAIQAMHDWVDEGGKVFATHYHYVWFKDGPADFANTATWLGASVGAGQGNYAIDQSFPKGQLFDQWLQGVGALTGPSLPLNGVADSVSSINQSASRWVYDPATSHTKYMSFVTPIGGVPGKTAGEAPTYCGKAVFSDLHAGGMPAGNIPAACQFTSLTAQEKALEFLFFDLSACVSSESKPPPPPPPSEPPPK